MFHSGILTSFTSVFHTSYNVFHGTHGKQTCKFEVKLSASKPSEPSEARRARLQSITLSGTLTYMEPEFVSQVVFAQAERAERSEASEASEHHLVRDAYRHEARICK